LIAQLASCHEWRARGIPRKALPSFDKFGGLFLAEDGDRKDFKGTTTAVATNRNGQSVIFILRKCKTLYLVQRTVKPRRDGGMFPHGIILSHAYIYNNIKYGTSVKYAIVFMRLQKTSLAYNGKRPAYNNHFRAPRYIYLGARRHHPWKKSR
jgi:hypothetical protein